MSTLCRKFTNYFLSTITFYLYNVCIIKLNRRHQIDLSADFTSISYRDLVARRAVNVTEGRRRLSFVILAREVRN